MSENERLNLFFGLLIVISFIIAVIINIFKR